MTPPAADVVVVGGGIAGLATAYELHRRGISVVVLERGARAGGVIFSEPIDGYTIDAGPDSLLIQKPDGIRLCEELGLGSRLVATKLPRLAYIQRAGRLHALPAASVLGIPTRFGPFVKTGLFSWPGKLRMGAEMVVPARRDGGDESIAAFMTRRFGAEATAYLAEPLLAGIHAGDVDRLSILSLFPRFAETERKHGSLLLAFRRSGHGAKPSPDGAFKSLPGGLSEMVGALVQALPAGTIRLNAAARSLSGEGPLRIDSADEAIRALAPKAVVLATPAYVTAGLLRERDAEIARRCDEVPYASTGTIVMAFPRASIAHPLTGSGYVVPRVERTPILAVSWLSSKWPGRAPDGQVLLRAFVGGARDPEALNRSDAELEHVALDAITPMLGVSGPPTLTRIYRWERANAQHEVGHLARMAAIDRALTRHPGLFLTGSGFRGVGIPDCVADGRATAKAVDEWLKTP
jgi:oxygen-dependent protoporphyrinogen oxidase